MASDNEEEEVRDEEVQSSSSDPAPPEEMGVPMAPPTLEDIEREFDANEEEKVEIESPDEAPEVRTIKNDQSKEDEEIGDAPVDEDEENDKVTTETSSNQRTDSTSEQNSQTRRNVADTSWFRIGVAIIVIMMVVILGLMIAVFRELQDDNDSDKNQNEKPGLPTSSPVTMPPNTNTKPTISNIMDTQLPTPLTTSDECQLAFKSISGEPDATLLTELQNCLGVLGDCQVLQDIPFTFQWLGMDYDNIFIIPDGTISFYKYGFANDVCASDCGGIKVAQRNVPHENYQGQVWTLATENYLTVSWENISFDGYCCDVLVNAQVTLYPNGRVEVCWGAGKSQIVYASIWDDARNLNFPMIGYPFTDFGSAEEWPTNQCRIFQPSIPGWTLPDESCQTPPYSCERPQRIEVPFEIDNSSLADGAEPPADDPADACERHTYAIEEKVVWYDFRGTGSCVCVELRSVDGPFMFGVYQDQTETDCESLTCMADSDFTSESVVLRTAGDQTYKIAVSKYSSGSFEKEEYQLRVVETGASVRCPEETNLSYLLPDSCP